jgi:hypothetical protein
VEAKLEDQVVVDQHLLLLVTDQVQQVIHLLLVHLKEIQVVLENYRHLLVQQDQVVEAVQQQLVVIQTLALL